VTTSREKIEKFRDDNPDLAPLPQMALEQGEGSPAWDRTEKLITRSGQPEMTEREYQQRSARWLGDTAAMSDPALMAERLKGQLQAYEMSLYRFSQFNFNRAIEITRNELDQLAMLIDYTAEKIPGDAKGKTL